jgi:uncharacterized membrane protein
MTASPSPAPASPDSRGRKLRLALAVSVALNLGVAGLALGMALHGGPGMHGDMVRDVGFGLFTEALQPGDRKVLRDQFMARMSDFKAERDRMQADAQTVLAALRATPFDAGALNTALTTMQDHVTARMDMGRSLIEAFLTAMTPDQRAAFADRLEASLHHGPGPGN